MEYRLVELDGFRVLGRKITTTMAGQEYAHDIPRFWKNVNKDGTINELMKLGAGKDECATPLGLCLPGSDENSFSYMIGVKVSDDVPVATWDSIAVPQLTWAVFGVQGKMPDAIQQAMRQIYGGPFPVNGHSRAAGPDIEVYFDGDMNRPDYRCEVWIPVAKA